MCAAKIRIPLADTEKSTPVDEPRPVASIVQPADVAAPTAAAGPGESERDLGSELPSSTDDSDSTPSSGLGGSIDFSDDTEATWYVRPPSGGQYGPATTEILKQWISEGRVAASALLWREGWPQWRDASEALPEFAHRLPESRGGSAALSQIPDTDAGPATAVQLEAQTTTSQPVAGAADVDAVRRSRMIRRVMTISLLSVVALSLILVLAMVLGRG